MAPPRYGIKKFGDLFTSRQLYSLNLIHDEMGTASISCLLSGIYGNLAYIWGKKRHYGSAIQKGR